MNNGDLEPKERKKWSKQPLSIREKAFIKAFTEVGADTYNLPQESAVKAGYTEERVEHTARRLMVNPKVLVAIDEVYAARFENTPTNIARVMSNLDNTEALALKARSMPTLTKIAELRGKYLDIWASDNAAAASEKTMETLARMTDEDKEISRLIARIRTDALANTNEGRLKNHLSKE